MGTLLGVHTHTHTIVPWFLFLPKQYYETLWLEFQQAGGGELLTISLNQRDHEKSF